MGAQVPLKDGVYRVCHIIILMRSLKTSLVELNSMFNSILIFSGLFLCSTINFLMLPSDINNLKKLVAVRKGGKEILLLEHSPEALVRFTMFKHMESDCPSSGDEPLPIDLNDSITPHMVVRLLMQAERLDEQRLFEESFDNTIALMCLAENLGADDVLKNKIAQIRYKDCIYDDLYQWHLLLKRAKNLKNIYL